MNTVITAPGYAEKRFPYMRPVDAATLILLDRSTARPKVLMGRRHPASRFMPGVFVFPGGRVDPVDRAMVAAGALDPRVESRLMAMVQRPSPQRARALAMAAIRETFEETGLLLGTRDYGAPDAPAGTPWEAFATHGVFPVLENLHYVARAVTPPGRPRRFDTRFFATDATEIAHRIDGVTGPDAELVELVWIDVAEALRLEAPWITITVLQELQARLDGDFSPYLPVPYIVEVRGKRFRHEIT